MCPRGEPCTGYYEKWEELKVSQRWWQNSPEDRHFCGCCWEASGISSHKAAPLLVTPQSWPQTKWKRSRPNHPKDFPVAQMLKNLPTMHETRVRSLSWEDPLEKRMAIHSSILAWRIPRTEKPRGLQFVEWQRVGHNWVMIARWTRAAIAKYHTMGGLSMLMCGKTNTIL